MKVWLVLGMEIHIILHHTKQFHLSLYVYHKELFCSTRLKIDIETKWSRVLLSYLPFVYNYKKVLKTKFVKWRFFFFTRTTISSLNTQVSTVYSLRVESCVTPPILHDTLYLVLYVTLVSYLWNQNVKKVLSHNFLIYNMYDIGDHIFARHNVQKLKWKNKSDG